VLLGVKVDADGFVLQNTKILNNEVYFSKEMIRLLIAQFTQQKIKLNAETSTYINNLVVKEYMNEFNGGGA
jgi:type I restriction enzyme R subunit